MSKPKKGSPYDKIEQMLEEAELIRRLRILWEVVSEEEEKSQEKPSKKKSTLQLKE